MTLYVALLGSDGIVLAGDKLIVTTDVYASKSDSPKIMIDAAKGVAVAWACDEIAETIANEILDHEEILEDESKLRKLADETFRKNRKDWAKQDLRAELMAVSQKYLEKFFYLEVTDSHCTVRPEESKFFIGHTNSAACYLTERYYERAVSVSDLTSLAAHTILAAGHLHPMNVKGLDIVKCTQDGIFRVPDSEIELLKQQEKKNSRKFRRLLLGKA